MHSTSTLLVRLATITVRDGHHPAGVSTPIAAQSPNELGVETTLAGWHLNSADVDAARRMFLDLGGTAAQKGGLEAVEFPGVTIYLQLERAADPAERGTVGTVMDHVGFTVLNVPEAVARWEAAGVPVELSERRPDQAPPPPLLPPAGRVGRGAGLVRKGVRRRTRPAWKFPGRGHPLGQSHIWSHRRGHDGHTRERT